MPLPPMPAPTAHAFGLNWTPYPDPDKNGGFVAGFALRDWKTAIAFANQAEAIQGRDLIEKPVPGTHRDTLCPVVCNVTKAAFFLAASFPGATWTHYGTDRSLDRCQHGTSRRAGHCDACQADAAFVPAFTLTNTGPDRFKLTTSRQDDIDVMQSEPDNGDRFY